MTDRILYVTPDITEDLPPELREGLMRRRLCVLEGRCPCGATLTMPNREQRRAARGRVTRVTIEHEHDCPATDPRLDQAVSP